MRRIRRVAIAGVLAIMFGHAALADDLYGA
jgi:hypothetical protein